LVICAVVVAADADAETCGVAWADGVVAEVEAVGGVVEREGCVCQDWSVVAATLCCTGEGAAADTAGVECDIVVVHRGVFDVANSVVCVIVVAEALVVVVVVGIFVVAVGERKNVAVAAVTRVAANLRQRAFCF
jgi:hypothetical protein